MLLYTGQEDRIVVQKGRKKIPDFCLEPVLNFNIGDGPKPEPFALVSEETDIGVQRGHSGWK